MMRLHWNVVSTCMLGIGIIGCDAVGDTSEPASAAHGSEEGQLGDSIPPPSSLIAWYLKII